MKSRNSDKRIGKEDFRQNFPIQFPPGAGNTQSSIFSRFEDTPNFEQAPYIIDHQQPLITVADTSDLDFETTPTFNFEVVVRDRAAGDAPGRTDQVDVTVNLSVL
ncbi:cadherin repeat domain-containing protein [Dactylococcopsis salina]|uniref:Cadherin domain-containing protein n=1 Tax=Dactylococcopsis salina (strain PCC 8305) TaxID=13035 RepID=K9YPI6_DACS8|nr:cadherin repeat domain-containing protein [Dactylococcopsis salina]AFZ48851.1 hypothetical protein Dacsa_0028 [Dactylococcopsis salina PCC 8305]